jgi:cellulose synthase/poly-beta-1,6-N-acetylglucosamine synthase-like glycosyltransferase
MTTVGFWIIASVLIAGVLSYILFLGMIYRGLKNVKQWNSTKPSLYPTLSVVIPARDEKDTIAHTLECLLNQDYPRDRCQIIVVNDRSSDTTADIADKFAQHYDHIQVITLNHCPPSMSPKKHALTEGIKLATGEIIITTDADCRFHPQWLTTLVGHFAPDVGVVAGLTRFYLQKEHIPLWQKTQWLDFISHSFVSAGAIGSGLTFNCNGSNLAYRKKVFDQVDGFSGVDRIVSGDDEFFAQKVNQNTPWKIRFAHEPPSIVLSKPVNTIKGLFNQRFRWGSKGLFYHPFLKTVLIITYIYYLALFLTPISFAWYPWMVPFWAAALMGKIALDLSVLIRGCRVFRIRRVLNPIVPAEILHVPMMLLFATAGHLIPFKWKGANFRSVRHAKQSPVEEAV